MGYVDYFLIVWDFVSYARKRGIPVGLRGSGAGSLVNHALGDRRIESQPPHATKRCLGVRCFEQCSF